jgi:5-methylcytosine-specific restriction endonuclease McrA
MSNWHTRDQEKKLAWQRDYKKKRRQKIKDYLGGKCVGCGTTENLQFDHIDKRDRSFKIANHVCMAWDKLTAEADKCQLLCKECHQVKTSTMHDMLHLRDGYKVSQVTRDGDDYVIRLSPTE